MEKAAPIREIYIILAHHLPDQVIRLVKRLETHQSTFLIHWDRRSSDSQLKSILARLDGCDVAALPRHACYWGTFSIVAATLEGIRAACASPRGFDRLILLSGQDYPIKPAGFRDAFFRAHAGQSFVHHMPFPNADLPNGGWSRIQLKWERRPDAPDRVFQPVLDEFETVRDFPMGLEPHRGAQFWVMTEEAARYVHEFTNRHPEVLAFFEHVFVPDEIYFQTVLASSGLAQKIQNDTAHFLEWKRPGNVLVSSDLENLQQTYHLFARKFDSTVDPHIFDLIDETILCPGAGVQS
jgi:Core-2/I-Branching enzyme